MFLQVPSQPPSETAVALAWIGLLTIISQGMISIVQNWVRIREGRRTDKKVEEVHTMVNGKKETMENHVNTLEDRIGDLEKLLRESKVREGEGKVREAAAQVREDVRKELDVLPPKCDNYKKPEG